MPDSPPSNVKDPFPIWYSFIFPISTQPTRPVRTIIAQDPSSLSVQADALYTNVGHCGGIAVPVVTDSRFASQLETLVLFFRQAIKARSRSRPFRKSNISFSLTLVAMSGEDGKGTLDSLFRNVPLKLIFDMEKPRALSIPFRLTMSDEVLGRQRNGKHGARVGG